MKKFFTLTLLVSMLFGSCYHNAVPEIEGAATQTHTISATTDIAHLSRAGFERQENAYKHFWEEDDAITIFPGTEVNTSYTLVEGSGNESAFFKGEAEIGEGNFFAVYPYNANTSLSGSALSVEYLAVQNLRTDKASYDKNSYLMVACGSKDKLSFKNSTAVVRVSLTGSATLSKIELKSIAHEVIAGTAEITFKDGEPVVSLSGNDEMITLNTSVQLTAEPQHLFISIPPVALSKGFAVTVYDNAGYAMTKTHTFNRTIERNTVVEMPAFEYIATDKVTELPVADMLDIVFLADGTAKDISPRRMTVETIADKELLKVPFDYTLGQYIASFDHAQRFIDNKAGSHSTGFYKIDFANDSDFLSKLSDGQSWETLVMMDAEAPTTGQNDKWFSAVQGGGVGFAVGTQDDGYDFRFNVNLTTTGKSNWATAASGVTPQRGVWYHIVGVWDNVSNTVSIYVDGVKKGSSDVDEAAVFFIKDSYKWVCVGADTSKNNIAGEGWDGDVAIARIYDKPLTDEQVLALYNNSYRDRAEMELITDVNCLKEETVSDGYNFMIYGSGFTEGDTLKLRSTTNTYECITKVYPDGASLTIPADFVSGIYNIELVRGTSKQILAEVNMTMSSIPQADMLDVVFAADGTAHDTSCMQSEIVSLVGEQLRTYLHKDGSSYIARFTQSAGADSFTSNFYYVPYVKTNAFALKQADSHTFEALASIFETNDVSCLMATHQSGGSAFRLAASESGYTDAIAFVPHVGGSYQYAWSEKSQLETNTFYHLVGVWNQESGDVILYVNGELAGIVTGCTGSFKDSVAPYLLIGGDPTKTMGTGQNAWKGDVATARVYDKALSAEEVQTLYNEAVNNWPYESSIKVENVRLFSTLEVATGWKYSIYGDGILTGDVITLKSTSTGVEYQCTTTSIDGKATIVIPEGLPSDSFEIILYRGEEFAYIASATLTVTSDAQIPRKPKTIAHRGYRYIDGTNDLPDNSIAALKRSQELVGLHSTEFDIMLTADNVLIINHDATIGGVDIQTSNYSEIENMTLSNGEKLPTLDTFLEQYITNTTVKLFIHVKNHATTDRSIECIDAIIAKLREKNILNKAEWLVSYDVLARHIIQQCKTEVPDLMVATAEIGDTFETLAAEGMTLNYKYTTVDSNPALIKQIHQYGLEMIVWSITSESALLKYMALGCDYIHANRPELLLELNKLTFIEE